MYIPFNSNPMGRRTDDCVIRAVSRAFDIDWIHAYDLITDAGRKRFDMPEANHVWIGFLAEQGYDLYPIQNSCPDCYTIRDFCRDHPDGTFIIGTGTHVVTAIDGDWYDTYNSGDLIPVFYLRRR